MSLGFDLRLVDTIPCVVRPPADGPQLLILPPLFEEMNRTRRLLAQIGQALSATGIGSWLPDLPATGDSALPTEAADWRAWRATITTLADTIGTPHVLALRGGALLANAATSARSLYRLAPVIDGSRLVRELLRARAAADREAGIATDPAALEAAIERGDMLDLSGYAVPAALATALRDARAIDGPIPTRTAVLGDGAADVRFDGPPVWRQAEPLPANALADALAADIARWIARCC